jgi:hypothetical protein
MDNNALSLCKGKLNHIKAVVDKMVHLNVNTKPPPPRTPPPRTQPPPKTQSSHLSHLTTQMPEKSTPKPRRRLEKQTQHTQMPEKPKPPLRRIRQKPQPLAAIIASSKKI